MKKIGNKSGLEAGYVFAPYIIQTTTSVIVGRGSSKSYPFKPYSRKRKINKIFNIGIEIFSDKAFSPSKMLKSRYSVNSINPNFYGTITS